MNSVVLVLYFSESRNPFVEQAVQYDVAAAHVTFDKDKKDALNKILLQGNV
jgi:phosphomevalonate kinase